MIHRRHARIAGQAIFGGLVDAAATTAFLARTSGLDATHIAAYKALINGLVADGVWAKLDLLQIYATQDQTTANLNLVSASFTASATGAPTWTADRGYTTASNKWVDCNWNPATDAINWTQNGNHVGVWSGTTAASFAKIYGLKSSQNGNIFMLPRHSTDDLIQFRENTTTTTSVAGPADASGFFVANRTNSSTQQAFRNGSQVGSDGTATSAAPTSATLQTGGDNTNSSNTYAGVVRALGAGGSLTSTDIANYYSRMSAFMTAIGATP